MTTQPKTKTLADVYRNASAGLTLQPTETMNPAPTSSSIPVVYTLRLGAVNGERPNDSTVAAVVVRAGIESFSLGSVEGWFRGLVDPGWAITVAHSDDQLVVNLAESLRLEFRQEGVGLEVFGRYLRCRADHGPAALLVDVCGLRRSVVPVAC